MLKKLAGKSTSTLEKRVQKNLESPGKYPEAEKELEKLLKSKEDAAKQLEELLQEKSQLEPDFNYLKKVVKNTSSEIQKWLVVEESVDKLLQNKIKDSEIDKVIMDEARWYQDTFGTRVLLH